jgi:hypothetical protein
MSRGATRSNLYRHAELRALIQEQRLHGREALTLMALAVEIDQLRKGLEAVAARNPPARGAPAPLDLPHQPQRFSLTSD